MVLPHAQLCPPSLCTNLPQSCSSPFPGLSKKFFLHLQSWAGQEVRQLWGSCPLPLIFPPDGLWGVKHCSCMAAKWGIQVAARGKAPVLAGV